MEQLQLFHDCLYNIPLSPWKQCWFMQDIDAALESIYLQKTLKDVPLELNVVLRGERMTENLLFSC